MGNIVYNSFAENEPFDYEKALLNDKKKRIREPIKGYNEETYKNIETIYDMLTESAKKYEKNRFIGKRVYNSEQKLGDFVWETYSEGLEKIDLFACGLDQIVKSLDKSSSKSAIEDLLSSLKQAETNQEGVSIPAAASELTQPAKTDTNQSSEIPTDSKNRNEVENGNVESNVMKHSSVNMSKTEETVGNSACAFAESAPDLTEDTQHTIDESKIGDEDAKKDGPNKAEMTTNDDNKGDKNIVNNEELKAENGKVSDHEAVADKEETKDGEDKSSEMNTMNKMNSDEVVETDSTVQAEQVKDETQKVSQTNGDNEHGNTKASPQASPDEGNPEEMKTKPEETIDYTKDSHESIGFYSFNRPEWVTGSFAAQSVCFKSVPLYDTFGKEALSYIISNTNLRVVVCSKNKISNLIEGEHDSLRVIIQMDYSPKYNNESDAVEEEAKLKAKERGLELIGFSQVLELGQKFKQDFNPQRPRKENLAFVMYTSGTSGTPKGVMLTHDNAISIVKQGLKYNDLGKQGPYLSFLTMAHIFETLMQMVMYFSGSCVGFYNGDIKLLVEDMKLLQPFYFASVPRVVERLYEKIQENMESSGFLRKLIFKHYYSKAIAHKRDPAKVMLPAPGDSLVWSKVRERIGFKNMRILLTGGAPIANYLMEFLRVIVRGQVIQGYGLTETFAVISLGQGDDSNLGHVGPPIGVEVRFDAVPDTNYSPEGEQCTGEICVRGRNVFVGYFKNPEATKEVLKDGWFSTGDVGRLNLNGTISIIDRKKALFKLSQGEYVSPEAVEMVYRKAKSINQIWVYGASHRNYLVAVVIPTVHWTLEQLEQLVKDDSLKQAKELMKNTDSTEFTTAFDNLATKHEKQLKASMLADMKEHDRDLLGFQKVQKIILETKLDDAQNGFTVENNCMTPSLKLRRNNLFQRYKSQIDSVYDSA